MFINVLIKLEKKYRRTKLILDYYVKMELKVVISKVILSNNWLTIIKIKIYGTYPAS